MFISDDILDLVDEMLEMRDNDHPKPANSLEMSLPNESHHSISEEEKDIVVDLTSNSPSTKNKQSKPTRRKAIKLKAKSPEDSTIEMCQPYEEYSTDRLALEIKKLGMKNLKNSKDMVKKLREAYNFTHKGKVHLIS